LYKSVRFCRCFLARSGSWIPDSWLPLSARFIGKAAFIFFCLILNLPSVVPELLFRLSSTRHALSRTSVPESRGCGGKRIAKPPGRGNQSSSGVNKSPSSLHLGVHPRLLLCTRVLAFLLPQLCLGFFEVPIDRSIAMYALSLLILIHEMPCLYLVSC
jgi:hypothetical protein